MQLRNHKSILVLWLILFLFLTNNLGADYGIGFLFLEPEYLGHVSFWSLLLLGFGLGTFIASYQIGAYILDSYRFHFLAMEEHPFYVFFINNLLITQGFFAAVAF